MKIVVLNGSPKGDLSVTMQYVLYLAKAHPQHEFKILNIAQQIKRIESSPRAFGEIVAEVRGADGVLWGFPLYFLLVHAHYKRFIELIFERGVQDAFAGKYAATLSTSIHYFDHTAHNYMQGICDDLGMRFVEAYSADMSDLMKEPERKRLLEFGKHFMDALAYGAPVQRQYSPLEWRNFTYQPDRAGAVVPTQGKKVAIVYDGRDLGGNLKGMIARCQTVLAGDVSVVDLREVDIKGSCQGCLKCGSDNECVYEGRDGYIDFFRQTITPADVLVFGGAIHDRYLSARWKTFFDRSFFNTHTPSLTGKQLVYLISGPFGQIPNLREILQAHAEFQGANLVGIVGDEQGSGGDIDRNIDYTMGQAVAFALTGYGRPMTFLGVGGMKVFRDDIWGRLRPMFQADHRAFDKLGLYKSFPQADRRNRLFNAVAMRVLSVPRIKKGFKRQIRRGMVAPHKKIVESFAP